MADATQQAAATPRAPWPLLRSLAGWRRRDLSRDLAAGLTLAAIAVPEQMATARLGGFPPEIGLFVFVAATLGFAVFGSNRYLSSGADSTITPIFAGALALVAVQGSPGYAALAAALALSVGIVLVLGGLARMGWIANLLSVPVTSGFLAGIAVHIVVSQMPAFLGVAPTDGNLLARLTGLAMHLGQSNPYTLVLGLLVFGAALASEELKLPIPGTLVGLVAAMIAVGLFGLEHKGVAVVGAAHGTWPHFGWPAVAPSDLQNIAALTLIVATVIMVQTAATTRAFTSVADPQDVNRDFVGVGVGSILTGLFGLFPVNASPPRTAVVQQAGGRSQIAGLAAAACVALLAAFGTPLLRYLPAAALAGVLLIVALRITRPSTFVTVLRQSPAEFALILATIIAIVVLPIQIGVAIGIGLSLLHGFWTITRTRTIEFEKVPGTTVWWPPSADIQGEKLDHVRVVAFQAPLSFLNAHEFRHGMIQIIETDEPRLIVLEASSIVEIDFTASQILDEIIARCRERGIVFAIARLTSLRAQQALVRFGIVEKLGPHGLFRSVDEAIHALAEQPDRRNQGSRPSEPPRQPETL
ncbi:MAG: SulP family inorganic anion transporter [Rhizomicrobium sp.]